MKFPKGFIWGTATASHQIEGNNKNNDWWHWENNKTDNRKYPLESSDVACDSYNRYEVDFDYAKAAFNNGIRLSIEWSRIEPTPGYFDPKEITHYRKVLKAAKDRGLKTFVTLHHFTNPKWFSDKKSWLNSKSPSMFSKYAYKCAKEFDDLIDYYTTINEPQVVSLVAYVLGIWPPEKKNIISSFFVQINLMRAHKMAYKEMRKVTSKPIGIVKNVNWFETKDKANILDKIVARFLYFLNSGFYIRPLKKYLDFIGLNYYFTNRIEGLKRKNLDDVVSDLNWWINPKGLENILVDLKKYKLPIYITENGLADSKDKQRSEFIKDMLTSAWNSIQSGTDLRGYFHWTLIDNFEWHHGFWPRFGLIEIDRRNDLKRIPRKSFYYYANICKNNEVDA